MGHLTENGLLYTFSTLAQCIAAAFGILGAFALFRLQAAEGYLWDHTEMFVGQNALNYYPDESVELEMLRSRGDYRGFLEALGRALSAYQRRLGIEGAFPWGDNTTTSMAKVERGIEIHRAMKRRLLRALSPTAITLVYTISAIPFSSWLLCYPALAIGTLILSLILLVACLAAYFRLIQVAVGLGD